VIEHDVTVKVNTSHTVSASTLDRAASQSIDTKTMAESSAIPPPTYAPKRLHANPPFDAGQLAVVATANSTRSSGADVDVIPQSVFSPSPNYPAAALQARREGRVVLRVRVAADGQVSRIGILTSSGDGSLDAAARSAVSRWRFEPARRAGIAVATEIAVPIRFEIRDKPRFYRRGS
jgi:protein TonB